MPNLWEHSKAVASGFIKKWLKADSLREYNNLGNFDIYSWFEARKFRYELFWSFYESNVFEEGMHSWAASLKAQFGMYKNTRNIMNPCQRLGEFWASHLHGGPLDPKAGDGTERKTALPIFTDRDYLRPTIAKCWEDSNWRANKGILDRYGPIMGDVGLMAVDDPDCNGGCVKLKVIHPGHIKWLNRDHEGNVTEYIIEEVRYDPRHVPVKNMSPLLDPRYQLRTCVYHEEAFIEDGQVTVRTYLDGGRFDWQAGTPGGISEWQLPYPFIPLRVIQHKPFGLDWGMSELHSLISKVMEVDDMASGLGDQIRKAIRAPKLITGIAGIKELTPAGTGKTGGGSQDRNELVILTTPNADARPHDLTFPIDIEHTGYHVDRLSLEIEKDYPELRWEFYKPAGDISGKALREARRQAVTKVEERRPNYDNAIAIVQRMAMAIGSIRGYEGYRGLPEDWRDEGLKHTIGERPVFEDDPMDRTEQEDAFWTMVNKARQAGVPLKFALKKQGWTEADIAELEDAIAEEDARQAERMAAQGIDPTDPTAGGPARTKPARKKGRAAKPTETDPAKPGDEEAA